MWVSPGQSIIRTNCGFRAKSNLLKYMILLCIRLVNLNLPAHFHDESQFFLGDLNCVSSLWPDFEMGIR